MLRCPARIARIIFTTKWASCLDGVNRRLGSNPDGIGCCSIGPDNFTTSSVSYGSSLFSPSFASSPLASYVIYGTDVDGNFPALSRCCNPPQDQDDDVDDVSDADHYVNFEHIDDNDANEDDNENERKNCEFPDLVLVKLGPDLNNAMSIAVTNVRQL